MKSNTAKRDVLPAPRERLADAIARQQQAIDNLAKVQRAHEDASEVVYRCHDRIKAAEEALTNAEAGEGDRLASAALGEASATPSVEDAALTVTQARNDLEVARRTRDALHQRVERETKDVESAKRLVSDAVAEVMNSEIPAAAMLAHAQQLQAQLVAARVVLKHLYFQHYVVGELAKQVDFFLCEKSLPGDVETENFDHHAALAPWREAAEALRHDANAPLPRSNLGSS